MSVVTSSKQLDTLFQDHSKNTASHHPSQCTRENFTLFQQSSGCILHNQLVHVSGHLTRHVAQSEHPLPKSCTKIWQIFSFQPHQGHTAIFFYHFMNFLSEFRHVHWNRASWPFFIFPSILGTCIPSEYGCTRKDPYTSCSNSTVWDAVLQIFKQNIIFSCCTTTHLWQWSSTEQHNTQCNKTSVLSLLNHCSHC